MKIPALISVALLLGAGAYSQGTIQYQNSESTLVEVSLDYSNPALVPAPYNSGYKVELFYQPDSGGFAPAAINASGALGNWMPTSLGVTSIIPAPGIFDAGNVSLNGISPGANVWLEVVGWNNNAPTFNAALLQSTLIASSPVWSQATGGSGLPPSIPASITDPGEFPGLNMFYIPEPSALAVETMGCAASLLLCRRKKSNCFVNALKKHLSQAP
jgi:hypothetical protein